jgi:hypothetical protein
MMVQKTPFSPENPTQFGGSIMGKPLGRLASIHRNGPGLKKLGNAKSELWYGPGYCGICGGREVVPVAVR